jgi:hypothetical protein
MYATNGALFPTWHLAWCHVLIFYGPSWSTSWVPYDSSPDLFVSLLPWPDSVSYMVPYSLPSMVPLWLPLGVPCASILG